MYPLINAIWTRTQTNKFYFYIRLHPHLRYLDSLMNLDGTKVPRSIEWRKAQWERSETRAV
jgi:hypothetical protein